MIESMNHASFTVSNLEKSIEFYNKILGLELLDVSERDPEFSEQVTGIEGASLKIAYLNASNCSLELVQYISPEGEKIDTRTCNVGSSHVCFNVSDFNDMLKKLKINNVKFTGKPSIIPGGPNKGKGVLYFEDFDGNSVEYISTDIVEGQII